MTHEGFACGLDTICLHITVHAQLINGRDLNHTFWGSAHSNSGSLQVFSSGSPSVLLIVDYRAIEGTGSVFAHSSHTTMLGVHGTIMWLACD